MWSGDQQVKLKETTMSRLYCWKHWCEAVIKFLQKVLFLASAILLKALMWSGLSDEDAIKQILSAILLKALMWSGVLSANAIFLLLACRLYCWKHWCEAGGLDVFHFTCHFVGYTAESIDVKRYYIKEWKEETSKSAILLKALMWSGMPRSAHGLAGKSAILLKALMWSGPLVHSPNLAPSWSAILLAFLPTPVRPWGLQEMTIHRVRFQSTMWRAVFPAVTAVVRPYVALP